jgi:hypothetical protein
MPKSRPPYPQFLHYRTWGARLCDFIRTEHRQIDALAWKSDAKDPFCPICPPSPADSAVGVDSGSSPLWALM